MNMQANAWLADGDDEAFRQEARNWLEANCPPSMRTWLPLDEVVWGGRNAHYANPDSLRWLQAMAKRGWVAPSWPVTYGGAGLSERQAAILQEELNRINARPPLISFPLWMLGPALMAFGSEAQKLEHLPKIARGEIRWCQGYSEPEYGSDLAGVQTRAEDHGDHYLVTGNKVWTSYADKADWMFCLVRTDKSAKKQKGMGFLLIDMKSPGIEVSPIPLISGSSPFCQVYLDHVRVPKENMVGSPTDGWTIAKSLLEHERQWFADLDEARIGHIVGVGGNSEPLEQLALDYMASLAELKNDPVLRSRMAEQAMAERALGLTARRLTQEGNESSASLVKYCGAKLFKSRYDLMLDIMGMNGLGWEEAPFTDKEVGITRGWLRSRGNSIEGGTSEIQLNIIAKRCLDLPD